MEKGFATPLHKPSECISLSSAKGLQTPSPYAGVDEVFEEGGGQATASSRAWAISRLLTGRTWDVAKVHTAAVHPSNVVNSTS
jgi:hypothetical protein